MAVTVHVNVAPHAQGAKERVDAEPGYHQRDAELQPARHALGYRHAQPSTTAPTRTSEAVCPTPHSPPTGAERNTLRCWLTIVETATTWSTSVACLRPNTSPRPRSASAPADESSVPTSADPRQLFADQHVHDARAAEARVHRHDALRLGLHLADDARLAAVTDSASCARRVRRRCRARQSRSAFLRWRRRAGRGPESRTRP